MNERKAWLRAHAKEQRLAVSAEARARSDAAICEKVCSTRAFAEAKLVFAYLSFGAEVETRGIIERAWAEGKVLALPRCVGPRQMRWFRVESFDELEKSPFGMLEPPLEGARELLVCDDGSGFGRDFDSGCAGGLEGACAVAVVPGLAFDAAGFRLGYGGGYYDAFLAKFPGVSIGLCRRAQMLGSLAAEGALEPHDRPVDFVITD